MSANQNPKLQLFFVSRALSTFGDEVWEIALPIFFATAGFTSQQMGIYYSVFATGTVLGFLILPRLAKKFDVAHTAVAIDYLQMIIFGAIAAWLYLGYSGSLLAFSVCGFFLAAAIAIWFGSSETLATQIVDKASAQSFHRMNYLSSTLGPLIAPMVASSFFVGIGLVGIALFNVLTFIPQIIAVKSLRKESVEAVKLNSAQTKKETFSFFTLLAHPHYGPLLGVTSTVKVGLLGTLPFIAFVFTNAGLNVIVLGVILATFSLGSVLGALFYRVQPNDKLAAIFRRDTAVMFLSAALIIGGLKFRILWLVPLSSFLGGAFSARFSIEMRAMRQLLSPPAHIPSLVSLQGLFSRVVTPLAGIIYGFLFAAQTTDNFAWGVAFLVAASGILFSSMAANGFDRVLEEKQPHA